MSEPLVDGRGTPSTDSTHVLVVEWDVDEREHTSGALVFGEVLSYSIECSGVRPSCEAWRTCPEPHSPEHEEAVGDSGTEPLVLHGIRHLGFEEGLSVPTGGCFVAEASERWRDQFDEEPLAPGRYPVDFVVEDEFDCTLLLRPEVTK